MFEKYDYGLIVGRFQPLHKGHEKMIDLALQICQTVVIFIGSAQESGTKLNPFSYDVRKEMIKAVYNDYYKCRALSIYPLKDLRQSNAVVDDEIWGNYVLDQFNKVTKGKSPNVFIYGDDGGVRSTWFNNTEHKMIEVIIPRLFPVSGTSLRESLLNDNKNHVISCMNDKLRPYFCFLQDIMKGVNEKCLMQDK